MARLAVALENREDVLVKGGRSISGHRDRAHHQASGHECENPGHLRSFESGLNAWTTPEKYNAPRRRSVRFRLIFAGLVSAGLAVGIYAQKAGDGDWPMYAHDLAGTKFSPL